MFNLLIVALHEQFRKMCETGKLFRSSKTGSEVWDLYLKSFAPEHNQVFRDPNSSEHNCNCCHNFIRRYGNIVAIDTNGNLISIFSGIIENVPLEYQNSVRQCAIKLEESQVRDVFYETFEELNSLPYEKTNKNQEVYQLGIIQNFKKYTQEEVDKFGVVNTNDIYDFQHMHLFLPRTFVDFTGKSIEQIMAIHRDKYNVFKRAMEEIPLDTLNLVRDLIEQGSLLDGTAHLEIVRTMIIWKASYEKTSWDKSIWCWLISTSLSEAVAKFKNHLIGVLCTELAEGKELNEACQAWNKRVDPANYHKATAPITKKQIEEAKKFVQEQGYTESFERRLATLEDIKASEIKYMNVEQASVPSVSIFDNVKATSTIHKRAEFDKLEIVPIEKFMKDILRNCTSVEMFIENRLESNLVCLTTSVDSNSKPIFKWDNNYSWTFNGNLAGKSQIKQAVKTAGGNVEGILRFSLIWNDGDGRDNSDLDAWCSQPDRYKIGYNAGYRKDSGNKFSSCGGQLDLDNRTPNGKLAVENIYFTDINKLKNGTYKFWVNQFSARNSQGFKAEIEFNGESFNYEYNKPVSGDVTVAEVIFKDGEFTVKHSLPCSEASNKEFNGLTSGEFRKVNLVCLSPNHWGENKVGNLHYLFMLDGCKFETPVRGFHNENLISDLLQHRKVLEVLGNSSMITPTNKHLAGIGFNSTVRDEVVVRLKGSHNRLVKLQF